MSDRNKKTHVEATSVAVAVAVPTGQAIDDVAVAVVEEKQGRRCDYRRTVIILESIAIVWSIFPIAFNFIYLGHEIAGRGAVTNMAFAATNVLASAVGIAGASKFNSKYLSKAAGWAGLLLLYIVYTVVTYMMAINADPMLEADLVMLYLYLSAYYGCSVVLFGILLYALIALFREIERGTMSEATYDSRESHSCCCCYKVREIEGAGTRTK